MTPAQIKAAIQQAQRYGMQLAALDRTENYSTVPGAAIWEAWRVFLAQFEYHSTIWMLVNISYRNAYDMG